MSKRQIRRPIAVRFPYAKSVVASFVLLAAMMFALAMLADPRSGEIRLAALAWLALAGWPAGVAVVFYAESRLRKKRWPASKGSSASDKC